MSELENLLQEGRDAYDRGASASHNPYTFGTAPYWNWLEGWEEASKKDEEDESGWL